jgi:hypothetical protein
MKMWGKFYINLNSTIKNILLYHVSDSLHKFVLGIEYCNDSVTLHTVGYHEQHGAKKSGTAVAKPA